MRKACSKRMPYPHGVREWIATSVHASQHKVRVGLRTLGVLLLLSVAPLAWTQGINVCGSNCDPPGYGACPNSEEQYFTKVAKNECRIDDKFKPRFHEWKKEYDRKAAEERADQERRQAELAREIRRLGPHREAEARRLVEMREAAEKARPKAKGSPSIGNDRKAEELACRMVIGQGTQKVPFNFTSREAAESALRFDASRSCKSSPNAGNAPIFSNLECKSKRETGLTSEKLRDFWSCSASFKCSMPHEVCEGKSAQGSAQ